MSVTNLAQSEVSECVKANYRLPSNYKVNFVLLFDKVEPWRGKLKALKNDKTRFYIISNDEVDP